MPKDRFQRLAEEKRLRILDAAIWEFAEHGYHGTSMRQIAERAGIAKGLTYYYFDSKEDLFSFLVEYVGGTWMREFERFLDGQPPAEPREFFRQFVRCLMEFIDSRPHMYQLYLKHVHDRDLSFMPLIVAQARKADARFMGCLRAAQAAGRVRAEVPLEKAHFVLDTVALRLLEFFFSPHMDALGLHDASREERMQVVEELFDLVWTGIGKN